jgi:hypothetical protein
MVHDFPHLSEFYAKHALGSKLAPSCLTCGKGDVTEPAIRHLELPDIVVCAECAEKLSVRTAEAQGETPKEVTKSGIPLTWTSNWRGGKAHIEWHAPCGCAWHPKPKPHWHPCEAHSPKHELSAKRDKLAEAANNMDWQQVALNGGPPCFHLEEDGRFCGRAERWAGHGDVHAYLSLAGLLERELSAKREGFVTVPRDVIAQGRTPPENSPDDHFRAGWRAAFMYLEDRIAAATREAQ